MHKFFATPLFHDCGLLNYLTVSIHASVDINPVQPRAMKPVPFRLPGTELEEQARNLSMLSCVAWRLACPLSLLPVHMN